MLGPFWGPERGCARLGPASATANARALGWGQSRSLARFRFRLRPTRAPRAFGWRDLIIDIGRRLRRASRAQVGEQAVRSPLRLVWRRLLVALALGATSAQSDSGSRTQTTRLRKSRATPDASQRRPVSMVGDTRAQQSNMLIGAP